MNQHQNSEKSVGHSPVVAHIPDVDEGPRARLVALLPLCTDATIEALLWHARDHLRAIQGIDCDAENKSG